MLQRSHHTLDLTQEIYWSGRSTKGCLWVRTDKKGTSFIKLDT